MDAKIGPRTKIVAAAQVSNVLGIENPISAMAERVHAHGGYLVVDPLATPRSVTLVAADGSTTDAFAKARRGNGSGSGEYIFQPASPGVHEVEWDRSFGFDLTWYEEEGEPPWS